MNDLIPALIQETRDLWNQGRKVMIQVAFNLSKIRESDAWGDFKTFPQFCENELGISQSQTSKLLTVAEYFLREYTPEQIGPCDYEALYMAAKLPGTVEENLAKAKTLKRSELRAVREEIAPCEHSFKRFCEYCWKPDEAEAF